MIRWILPLAMLVSLPAMAQPVIPGCPTPGSIPCTAINGNWPVTITVAAKPVTWIAPTSGTLTASATVVTAGPTVSIITNTTASGGGTLTLNLFGGTSVDNVGIPLVPGQSVSIYGQPTGTAITGKCSTGTCAFGAQSGS